MKKLTICFLLCFIRYANSQSVDNLSKNDSLLILKMETKYKIDTLKKVANKTVNFEDYYNDYKEGSFYSVIDENYILIFVDYRSRIDIVSRSVSFYQGMKNFILIDRKNDIYMYLDNDNRYMDEKNDSIQYKNLISLGGYISIVIYNNTFSTIGNIIISPTYKQNIKKEKFDFYPKIKILKDSINVIHEYSKYPRNSEVFYDCTIERFIQMVDSLKQEFMEYYKK